MHMIYSPSDTPVYLDLGGALAAFGLIFAVYQLRTPSWDLVLQIRSFWQRNIFAFLGAIGLLLTLVGIFISQFSICFLRFPFDVPLTYEIVAYLFFIASPLSLIYFSTTRKGLFNEKTARKFYEVMVWEIARTNNDAINAALEVLLYNFRSICQASRKNGKMNQWASAMLNVILSDESVVKILTTKRLDALQAIFAIVEECDVTRNESGIGIPKIVQNLFYDKESFFYKQLNGAGLALSSDIYKSIFDSPVMLTNFDLFGYPTLEYSMRKNVGISGVSVLIEALSRSIKTYLKTGDVPPRHINNGLSHLREIFGDICLTISTEEKRGVDTKYSLKVEWQTLQNIVHFLGHEYPFLAYQEELSQAVAEREKKAQEASFRSDSTINSGIAAALYKAFEELSYIEKTTDIYKLVVDLLEGMRDASDRKEGYRQPFENRMWKQISVNIAKRHYPAALKTYLVFIGYCAASGQNQGWV